MSDNEGTAIVPLGGDVDDLMQIAAHAEKRIDAVMKIKRVALKVTNAMDWVDQKDKPYLMASGSEKIANLFGISWRLLTPEPAMELEGRDPVGTNFLSSMIIQRTEKAKKKDLSVTATISGT
jgi:hypothetical protein